MGENGRGGGDDGGELARFAALERGATLRVTLAHPAGGTSQEGIFPAWAAAELLGLIAAGLPGRDCRSQSLTFAGPGRVDGPVTFSVTVGRRDEAGGTVELDCRAADGRGRQLLTGTVSVGRAHPPTPGATQVRLPQAPEVTVRTHRRYEQLLAAGRSAAPVLTAVVYPVDGPAITAAVEAARAGVIAPLLVGPAAAISAAAVGAAVDIRPWPIVEAPTDAAAATESVRLAREGRARLVMKGSLHTDTLLRAVLSAGEGFRRAPWLSHVFVFDVPTYPKPLLVTDAVVTVAPTLEQKAAICRNAVDVAHALGIHTPKVAILSAVEDVDPAIPSTVDAAALCKMADRGQIRGAVLDGPLALDNAISVTSAVTKGISSPVAGDADLLVVPNLEAGNILYKNLTYLAGADAAGVVVGAAVPIILTSRADRVRDRIASAALAARLLAVLPPV